MHFIFLHNTVVATAWSAAAVYLYELMVDDWRGFVRYVIRLAHKTKKTYTRKLKLLYF